MPPEKFWLLPAKVEWVRAALAAQFSGAEFGRKLGAEGAARRLAT